MRSEGDIKDSIRKLYCKYYNRLLHYGCCIEKDEGLVHDEIQELFVWLLRHPEKVLKINDPVTYLFLSLRRNIRSTAQRNKMAKNNSGDFIASKENEESCRETQMVEEETQRNQLIRLKNKIAELPPRQKEVIYLRFFENLSYNEMAEILETSNQVVRNIVSRSIKNLRQKYLYPATI